VEVTKLCRKYGSFGAGYDCCSLFGLRWTYQLWLQGVRYGHFNLNNAVVVVDGLVLVLPLKVY